MRPATQKQDGADREQQTDVRGGALFDDLESIFLDDWIGKHFLGDFFQLVLGFVTAPAIQIQHKEFPLADVGHRGIAEAGKCVLNGLPLWIKYRSLRHSPNVCFHAENYNSLLRRDDRSDPWPFATRL